MKYLYQFLDHLRSNHYEKNSISCYKQNLLKASKFFLSKNIYDEKCINEKDIVSYMEYLKSLNYTNQYCYRNLLSLKRFFKFLEEKNIIFINPALCVEYPKIERTKSKALDVEEIFEILNKIDTSTNYGIRLRMIFEVLYSSGIRPKELLNLKINDINFDSKSLFINQGKMKKDRIVPIGETALFWIKKYMNEVRSKCVKDKEKDRNYLLGALNQNGKKLDYASLRNIAYKSIKRYNLPKFRMYSFRISFATHLLQNGLNILYIKDLLGHSSLISTCAYLNVKVKNLQNELNKKHPRFKRIKQREIETQKFYKIMDSYREYLKENIRGKPSQGAYLSQAIFFIKFIEENFPLFDDISKLTTKIILAYKEYLKTCKYTNGNELSADRQLSRFTCVKHFLWFLIDYKYISYFPEIRNIQKIKMKKGGQNEIW